MTLRPVVFMPTIVVCEKAPPMPTPQSLALADPLSLCPFCFKQVKDHTVVMPNLPDPDAQRAVRSGW